MDCIQFEHPIRNNARLPHYPDPGLEETLERFLDWVRPLVTQDEWLTAQEQGLSGLRRVSRHS